MTETYRRNVRFKRDLPKYRVALREWIWRGKKTMTREIMKRYEVVQRLEIMILDWEVHEDLLTRFFIVPPDNEIKKVLSWD